MSDGNGLADCAALKGFLAQSNLALLRFTAEGRFASWSPRLTEIFGYSEAEVLGRTPAEIGMIHPGDLSAVAASVLALEAGAERWKPTENRNVRKDGTVIHCRWYNAFVDTDELRGYVSLLEDITAESVARTETLARLESSEERFRSVFDNNPDPMLALDSGGGVAQLNAAAGRFLEVAPGELIGHTLGDIVESTDLPLALAAFNRALGGLSGTVELGVRHSKGHAIPTLLTMIPIDLRGGVAGVYLNVRDLRARLAHDTQVAAHAERIRDLYLSAAAANENAEHQIAATIEAGCRILGLGSGALYEVESDTIAHATGAPIPATLARLALAVDHPLVIDNLQRMPAHLDAPVDALPFVALLGTPIDIGGKRFGSLCFAADRLRHNPFDEIDRDLILLMGALVASAIERGRARVRLRDLAYSDSVTALPNRAWLVERLRDELAHAEKVGSTIGVLFLDLDRFKEINDTLGHASGDRLLRIIGARLSRALRSGDVVARMGGDEFVVLAINAPNASILGTLAERIIAAVAEPIEIDGFAQAVTTSIGIAQFPSDGTDAETLVKHADVAMYRAKERGRHTYQFFTPELNNSAQTRLELEKALRLALERREFVVHYMPEHDLATGGLVAVEALVRWNHPSQGLVMPGAFIPTAEQSGLIVELGDYVLDQACTDVSRWRKGVAPNLRLAVNLGARQFRQQKLSESIHECLRRHALGPSVLELEIPESVAMRDATLAMTIMEELGAEGVRLSVDDFGTGYSSLGHLRRFPLDSIKIDRSFVAELAAHTPDETTTVRTVIAMAHSLKLEVVAEGVEDRAQLEVLRAERCDRVHGHFFSPAIPSDALERYAMAAR